MSQIEFDIDPIIDWNNPPSNLEDLSLPKLNEYLRFLRNRIDSRSDSIRSVERVRQPIVQERHKEEGKFKAAIDEFNAQLRRLKEELDEKRREFEAAEADLRAQIADLEAKRQRDEFEINKLNVLIARKEELDNALAAIAGTAKTVMELLNGEEGWTNQKNNSLKAAEFQRNDIIHTVHAYMQGKNGWMNCNEQGLGKTLEAAITIRIIRELFAKEHGRYPRILWLTKRTLTVNTWNEINLWVPENFLMPMPMNMQPEQREFLVSAALHANAGLITNYEMPRTTQKMREVQWDILIVDEVHKLKGGAQKNPSQVWTIVKDIAKRSRFNLFLTGTPIVNKPDELWAYFHIFAPEIFPTLNKFKLLFEIYNPATGEYIINVDKLMREVLQGQMSRLTVKEVGLQLPPYRYIRRELEMTPGQRKVNDSLRDRLFVWLDSNQDKALTITAIIAQITYLREASLWPASIGVKDPETDEINYLDCQESSKMDETMEIIEEAHADNEPVIVVATLNHFLKEVARRCRENGLRVGLITGETSGDASKVVTDLQQGNLDVVCLNSAMGEGLNLQKNPSQYPGGSRIMIQADLWWTAARNNPWDGDGQVERRINRWGATHDVLCYHLVNEKSIDSFIEQKVLDKADVFHKVMDDKRLRTGSEWKNLLEGMM